MARLSADKIRQIKEIGALLSALHPKAFPSGKLGESDTLLKIGIHHDIFALYPDLARNVVHSLMHWHTNSNFYLEASVEGRQRVDLDGNPAGEVAPEQARAARERLADRKRAKKGEQVSTHVTT